MQTQVLPIKQFVGFHHQTDDNQYFVVFRWMPDRQHISYALPVQWSDPVPLGKDQPVHLNLDPEKEVFLSCDGKSTDVRDFMQEMLDTAWSLGMRPTQTKDADAA